LSQVSKQSTAFKKLIGQDKWESFTVSYSFTTATSLTLTGRYYLDGRICRCQVKSTGTSLQTTAGTSYISLPFTAKGVSGIGGMTNDTTNIAVGIGHLDITDSRFYPPTQAASANDFTFWFEFEV
jgi:hypothetical protein